MPVTQDTATSGLQRAIESVGGNQSRLARLCGVKPQSVREWIVKGSVPPKRAIQIEKLLGIPRKDLNPEIFGKG